MRQDGSPPLYYMVLHVFTRLLGVRGEQALHAFSLGFAVLAIPVAYALARSLFSPRAGWVLAALVATNPFLSQYAQEARMYSLVVLLSLVTCATFAGAFVYGRGRRWTVAFALSYVTLLYTHNWGLFLGAGLALGLIPCWYVSEIRSSFWKDALIGFGGAGLLYLPWLPTLLHQVQHTGAPWLNPPNFGAPVQISKSLLGGGTPTVALLLAGGSGIAAILARRVEDKERTALLAGAVIVLGTLCVAWIVSQVSPAWTTRYLGVLLGPMLLLGSLGLARAGTLGLVALVIIIGIWAIPKSYGLENKSNASDLRKDAVPELRKDDLVLSMQPEQGPLLAYHLEELGGAPDLRFGNPMGAVKNDRVMDWTDAYDKLKSAKPSANPHSASRDLTCG
jgi:4-amino-4-deoxy-L-arabinose transferase-like glycosyltransferase